MADIDTSRNTWNPRPTHDDLIRIRDRMLGRLADGQPHRLIRGISLRTPDMAFALRKRERYHEAHPTGRRTDIRKAFDALATAQHLGLEVAGRVVETVEVDR